MSTPTPVQVLLGIVFFVGLGIAIGMIVDAALTLNPSLAKPVTSAPVAQPQPMPSASINWSREFQLAAQCEAMGAEPIPGFRRPIVCVRGSAIVEPPQ